MKKKITYTIGVIAIIFAILLLGSNIYLGIKYFNDNLTIMGRLELYYDSMLYLGIPFIVFSLIYDSLIKK